MNSPRIKDEDSDKNQVDDKIAWGAMGSEVFIQILSAITTPFL